MTRAAALALALIALAACASTSRVRALERRLAAMEQTEDHHTRADAAAQLELQARLVALRLEVDRLASASEDDAGEQLDRILARLDAIERRVVVPPRPARPQPDPAAVYAIPVAGAPALGSDDALVTIVRAGEYGCPYCEKVRGTLDDLRTIYGPKLRLVYLTYVVHPQVATEAAHAACAAHEQRRFWEMDALLWEKAFKTRELSREHLEDLATELGLDLDRFRADRDGPCPTEVQREMATLTRFGVGATPVFFINGRFLSGAQPLAVFQALVDEELAKAEARVKKTRKRKGYYDEWVLKQGLTSLAPAPAPAAIVGPTPP